jgi:hypothetical protein
LFLATIDEFDDGIGAQLLQDRIFCAVGGIENLSAAGNYGLFSVLSRVNEWVARSHRLGTALHLNQL